MDLSLVTEGLWIEYMKTKMELTRNDMTGYIMMAGMSDSDKAADLTTFLTARVAANAASIAALSTYVTDQTAVYNTDTALCNLILGS